MSKTYTDINDFSNDYGWEVSEIDLENKAQYPNAIFVRAVVYDTKYGKEMHTLFDVGQKDELLYCMTLMLDYDLTTFIDEYMLMPIEEANARVDNNGCYMSTK